MRFSEADLARIRRKAEESRMNVTAYITAAALDKQIVIVDDLGAVTAELKGIGRNLNQLTVLCHIGKIQSLGLGDTKDQLRRVYDALLKISESR